MASELTSLGWDPGTARSLARLWRASSYRPCKTNKRGEGGKYMDPNASMIPGMSWIASGMRQEGEPGTYRRKLARWLVRKCNAYVRDRVKKPVQNPRTTPRTMENCSSAVKEPRSSGGDISAMYKGDRVLCCNNVQVPVRRNIH